MRLDRNGRTFGWVAGTATALVVLATAMACDAFKESKHERKQRKKEEAREQGPPSDGSV